MNIRIDEMDWEEICKGVFKCLSPKIVDAREVCRNYDVYGGMIFYGDIVRVEGEHMYCNPVYLCDSFEARDRLGKLIGYGSTGIGKYCGGVIPSREDFMKDIF